VTSDNPFRPADDGPRHPYVRPKDAASLVLVRRDKDGVRVLMGERAKAHVFLPGRFVFPGGRLDVSDLRLAVPTDLRPEVRAKVAAGITAARARALALAAVRETFEETGLLVGKRAPAVARTRAQSWRHFFAQGVVPHLEALDFVARAITPPGRPRRFDARFFMVDSEHIAGEPGARIPSGELLKPVWLTFAEARAADILPITQCVLNEVEARLAPGVEAARPAPFYIPRRGKALVKHL
jgi:8-oxo-dGTP pyrophosphatase MutT (NUDIX family)